MQLLSQFWPWNQAALAVVGGSDSCRQEVHSGVRQPHVSATAPTQAVQGQD
jgi:hypothetical protein